jgi:hypothetical protein
MIYKKISPFIAASLLSLTVLQAQVLVPSADAMVNVYMGDIEHSSAKWEASPFGELWQSKQMASFKKPFDTWIEKSLKDLQEKLHLKESPSMSDLFTGELLFSLSDLDFSGEELKQATTHTYLAFECDGKNKLLEAIQDQILEASKKNKESKRRDVKFMGHSFHTQTLPQSKSNNGTVLNKALELRFGVMKNIAYIGVANKKDHEATLRRILASQKSKSSKKAHYAPEMTFTMNMSGINELILKGLAEAQRKQNESPAQPGPAMFLKSMDFAKVVKSLGLLDFSHVSMVTAEHPEFEKIESTVLMSQEPRGFISMFVPNATTHLGAIPNWVPENVLSFDGAAIPVSTWYDTIMTFLQQEMPMMAPMLQAQLGGLKKSMGLDLKRDLFDQFGDQFYQIGFEQDKNTPLEQMGQTTMVFTLKNGEMVEENLFKLLAMAPLPTKLEAVKYMGGQYYTLGAKANGLQSTIGFHKNHFMFAQSPEDIKKVIRLINKPSPKSLVKSKSFSTYRKLLPDRYQQMSFQNLDRSILGIFNLLKSNQAVLTMTMAKWPFQLDFSKLPGVEVFHDQFGNVMSFTVSKGTKITSEAYSKKIEL